MFEPGVKNVGPMTVAYAAIRGPYDLIPETFGVLYQRIEREKLTPAGMPMGVYLTDPAMVPQEQALWEVWAPVAGSPAQRAADDTGFGVKTIDAETVAFALHKGPYESIGETYRRLMGWVALEGHEVIGPPREAYLTGSETTSPEEYLTEVQLPIR